MIRDTCICETPMRSPISACVRSSAKRSRSTSRSRSVSTRISCCDRRRVLGLAEAACPRRRTRRRCRRRSRRRRRAGGRARPRGRRPPPRAPRAPARRVTPRRSASSPVVGDAAELARQRLVGRLELDGELLQVARDAHRPALVAEVALELAEDRRDGEARERRRRGSGRSGRSPSAGRARRPGPGRRAPRRRADSGARVGARAAGSAGRAARAPAGRRRGRARAARGRRGCAPLGRPGLRDMLAAHRRPTGDRSRCSKARLVVRQKELAPEVWGANVRPAGVWAGALQV